MRGRVYGSAGRSISSKTRRHGEKARRSNDRNIKRGDIAKVAP